ncbi:hypothetical protein GCM10011514_41880 [Emticicia aquatilis]|uniref:CHAT domain-containing protein n=1 Tax=Emticicia aquatilis TaxID=1537369 RepID=A0A916Z4L4_9BACT|nr:hypothetical protein [Emticicia aquatilis]GGD73449.1 hypothetical protein GCM10011514_41880 [Emticicia aquatilis]
MSKPIFLFVYANPDDNLENLLNEKAKVVEIIERRNVKDDFDYKVVSTRVEIVDFLKNEINRENLLLFSYSGHSAGDKLITEQEQTESIGIVQLLALCPNLKLLVLNGCSTKGWIQQLEISFHKNQFKLPVIIATSSKVQDKVAADFGIAFFEQLFEFGLSFQKSFDIAIAVIKTHVQAQGLNIHRFLDEMAKPDSAIIDSWIISISNESTASEKNINQFLKISDSNFQPNIRLFKTLITELSKHNSEIRKRYENNKKVISNIHPYKPDIYKSFPFPISKRLQRLDSSESIVDSKDQQKDFFNKVDKSRLGELIRTFTTISDLLFAIAQAELYNLLNHSHLKLNANQTSFILESYKPAKTYLISDKLFFWVEILKSKAESLFVIELTELSTTFFEIFDYFEKLSLKYATLSNDEAEGLVELVEIKLEFIFRETLFLINYNLTTIENILLNRRRKEDAKYSHQIYKQQWSGLEPSKDTETLETFLDNTSIILHKGNIESSLEYLNLSPFLLDDALFNEKATVSNLMVISKVKMDLQLFYYRYLIYGSMEGSGTKELMFQENSKFSNEIDFENRVFVEIYSEWELYFKTIENAV